MAISDKEAVLQMIAALPDDASLDDMIHAMSVRKKIERGLADIEAGNTVSHEDMKRDIASWRESVARRLVRKGHITVLEPVSPVPPLSAEIVNDLTDEMRREREHQFLGRSDEDS